MIDYQIKYYVRGIEMCNYVKADSVELATQALKDVFPEEIITIGQVIPDVPMPLHEKYLPDTPLRFPKTHYGPEYHADQEPNIS